MYLPPTDFNKISDQQKVNLSIKSEKKMASDNVEGKREVNYCESLLEMKKKRSSCCNAGGSDLVSVHLLSNLKPYHYHYCSHIIPKNDSTHVRFTFYKSFKKNKITGFSVISRSVIINV